jgi:hypothetical protein
MIVMVIAAVLGAALGVFVRPWLLAPVIAVTLGGGVQGGMIFVARLLANREGQERTVALLGEMAGTNVMALIPTVAAAGIAAVLAALLSKMADGDQPDEKFWIPSDEVDSGRARGKDGRRRRLAGMVEDREVHAKAEGRIGAILDL